VSSRNLSDLEIDLHVTIGSKIWFKFVHTSAILTQYPKLTESLALFPVDLRCALVCSAQKGPDPIVPRISGVYPGDYGVYNIGTKYSNNAPDDPKLTDDESELNISSNQFANGPRLIHRRSLPRYLGNPPFCSLIMNVEQI
jgi:hypothetical protein